MFLIDQDGLIRSTDGSEPGLGFQFINLLLGIKSDAEILPAGNAAGCAPREPRVQPVGFDIIRPGVKPWVQPRIEARIVARVQARVGLRV
jgi:hypothetical protein